jgi:hypothetical protein
VYLDDVIVIGRTFQEHLRNLQEVFKWYREARLKLNPEKCQLFHKEVRYLRHMVSPEGITTHPEKQNRTRIANPEEQTRNKKLLGPVPLLKTVYFQFCRRCETAD